MSRSPRRAKKSAKSAKARRAKTAAKKKVRRTSAKKTAQTFSKRKKRKAATKSAKSDSKKASTAGIGVLSSIAFAGTDLQTAFNQGLAMPGIYRSTKDKLGYDAASISAALANLNGDIDVTLIVSAGGVVTEDEAAPRPTKDTISLVGGRIASSPNPGGRFRDRLSLESFATNPRRLAHLNSLGIRPNEVCLFSNQRSKMRGTEHGGWGGRDTVTVNVSQTSSPQDITREYTDGFGRVAGGIKAVLISADPWFFETGRELVRIANQWVTADGARRICYPLQEYLRHGPARNQTTLYGPSLLDAYNLLGQMAAKTIDPAAPAPGRLQQICIDR